MNEIRYNSQVILVAKRIVIPWIRGSEYAGQAYLATRMDEALYISRVILVAKIIAMLWIRSLEHAGRPLLATRMEETISICQVVLVAKAGEPQNVAQIILFHMGKPWAMLAHNKYL